MFTICYSGIQFFRNQQAGLITISVAMFESIHMLRVFNKWTSIVH